MQLDQFKKIEVEQLGPHYLIPEETLKQLLNNTDWVFDVFEIPQRGDLSISFLIKHHRIAHNLKGRELARLISKDHKHILKLERGDIKNPDNAILESLTKQLGNKFKKGLKILGYKFD